jgi:hypothetical protein
VRFDFFARRVRFDFFARRVRFARFERPPEVLHDLLWEAAVAAAKCAAETALLRPRYLLIAVFKSSHPLEE